MVCHEAKFYLLQNAILCIDTHVTTGTDIQHPLCSQVADEQTVHSPLTNRYGTHIGRTELTSRICSCTLVFFRARLS